MGWVGVATLIATACFVLYRYPPRSWPLDPEPSSTPRPQPEPISEKTVPASGGEDVEAKNVKPVDEADSSRDGDGEEAEDAQSTPKASASTPVLQVPTFSLDDNPRPTTEQSSQGLRNDNHASIKQPSASSSSTPSIMTNNPESLTMPPPPQPSSTSSSLMPPPPLPRLRPTAQQNQSQPRPQLPQSSSLLTPGRLPPRPSAGNSLRPPPSAASSLRAPPTSSRPPMSNSLAPTKTLKPSPSSKRAVLEPGFSPLDWAALTSNPKNNLRGANLPPGLIRVTPSMLKAQNGRKGADAWTSYQGKVFNIQPYVPFHPGGKGELLRGAGKDSGKLFMEIHPWVNWDAILGECLVGILVSENEAAGENNLDSMD
ncbi:hypothetical protein ASPWEDRAFT_59810 [Aspergillus wentii DTO 134E9]|uniref:Cytochrome b5 heme-binding domain-containing protein n=1 Tax=Aspergillus wentii DTO 134E9 TaxID=1073089 RepID=A0A1L9RKR6_ASPWE|nr:uncharacterized protein ASPWEDRAFT_59810 [Aspergillus wentii DTO 134E9]KAI9924708.1 Cytochrome b5 reductase 4 [Aspergillus wentii]OJJ35526.1 hypothetical protein ASPWEDRAFT_59810 [Aspergillus wentii DTO 134E9]